MLSGSLKNVPGTADDSLSKEEQNNVIHISFQKCIPNNYPSMTVHLRFSCLSPQKFCINGNNSIFPPRLGGLDFDTRHSARHEKDNSVKMIFSALV